MKFTIERNALADTMAAITRIVEKSTDMPIRACVRIVAEDDRLAITGMDGHCWATIRVAADIASPGILVVNAMQLSDAVKACQPGSQIAAAVAEVSDGTQSTVSLTSGKARFRLPAIDPGLWSDGRAIDAAEAFTLSNAEFGLAFRNTAHAVSRDDARTYLHGTHLWLKRAGGEAFLRAAATDGSRLAMTLLSADEAATLAFTADPEIEERGVIVPRQVVQHLLSLVGTDGGIECRVTRSLMSFTHGDVTVVTKLLDSSFPDVDRVIPSADAIRGQASLDRGDLSAMAARLAPFATSGKVRAFKVAVRQEALSIAGGDDGYNAAIDELPAKSDREVTFGIQSKNMREGLEAGIGESVNLAFVGDKVNDPTIIIVTYPEEPRLTQIWMPVRLGVAPGSMAGAEA